MEILLVSSLVEKKVGIVMHRSQMDIIADILRVSRGGARKTHIIYRCNLSPRQLEAYLDFLTNNGLLREISKLRNSIFETTDKGTAFLQAYNGLKILLGGDWLYMQESQIRSSGRPLTFFLET